MKEKLISSLGIFGYIIVYIVLSAFAIAPILVLRFPAWATFVALIVIDFVPFVGTLLNLGLYIWAFVVAVTSPQNVFSIILYISFFFFLVKIVSGFFTSDTRRSF